MTSPTPLQTQLPTWQEDEKKRNAEALKELEAEEALHATPEWKAAGRIIKHLWVIFVALPFVLGAAFWILTQAAK